HDSLATADIRRGSERPWSCLRLARPAEETGTTAAHGNRLSLPQQLAAAFSKAATEARPYDPSADKSPGVYHRARSCACAPVPHPKAAWTHIYEFRRKENPPRQVERDAGGNRGSNVPPRGSILLARRNLKNAGLARHGENLRLLPQRSQITVVERIASTGAISMVQNSLRRDAVQLRII